MAEIEFIEIAHRGLEKRAVCSFAAMPAGKKIKIEVDEDELDVTVPRGKVWYGKVVVFVREDDV